MAPKKQNRLTAAESPPPASDEPAPKKPRAQKPGTAEPTAAPTSAAKEKPVKGSKPAQQEFVSHPHYLMKSEPDEFSLDDLKNKPQQTSDWDGVRNIQAMRLMRGMKVGTQVFFYQSSCKVPGIMGIAEVCRQAYPDHTAFNKASKYYDPKTSVEEPKWHMVDIKLVRPLTRQVTLQELRSHGEHGGPLANMALLRMPRLSVQPVTQAEWDFILRLEDTPAPADGKKGAGGPKKAPGAKKKAAESGSESEEGSE